MRIFEDQERENERIRQKEQERANELGQVKKEIGNFHKKIGKAKKEEIEDNNSE